MLNMDFNSFPFKNKSHFFFVFEPIKIFNNTNYFVLTFYILLTFIFSFFKINLFFKLFSILVCVIYLSFSTSLISQMIFLISITYLILHKIKITKFINTYFLYIIMFLSVIIIFLAKVIDLNQVEQISHNIYFRLMVVEYYLDTINFLNFIFPFTNYAIYKFSDHNQYFGFLMYGGAIFCFFIFRYIYYLVLNNCNKINYFTFTILLILVFGCFVQNFITHVHFGVILSFLINYTNSIDQDLSKN